MRAVFTLCLLLLLASCRVIPGRPVPGRPEVRLPQTPVTPRSVQEFSLEKPIRCSVDWLDQQIISTIPYQETVFTLKRANKSDPLPLLEVTDLDFADLPAEKIFAKLFAETDISVIALDAPYDALTADDISGPLASVVDMLADAAELFYRYNAETKQLILSRSVEWRLEMPESRAMILAILDALRGAGLKDIITDWEDKVLMFEGDRETEARVRSLTHYFDIEPNLLAFDIDVYRIHPLKKGDSISWQDMLRTFPDKTVKVSLSGVLGRMLIVSPDVNTQSLQRFLSDRAAVSKLSQGTFVLPNRWQSRFDIGECGHPHLPESDLSLLVTGNVETDRLNMKITLDTSMGEITRFSPKSRLGENLLIIGVPSQAFGGKTGNGELVILASPRIIRVLQADMPDEYIMQ